MRDTRDVSPAPEDDPGDGEPDLFGSLAHLSGSSRSDSAKTVWIALGANFLVGVAKSVAAVVTGSALMGGHRKRGVPARGQPAVKPTARPCAPTRTRARGVCLVAARGARPVRRRRRRFGRSWNPGADHARAGDQLRRGLRGARAFLCARGLLISAVGQSSPAN